MGTLNKHLEKSIYPNNYLHINSLKLICLNNIFLFYSWTEIIRKYQLMVPGQCKELILNFSERHLKKYCSLKFRK
jgi:hypothetical protein